MAPPSTSILPPAPGVRAGARLSYPGPGALESALTHRHPLMTEVLVVAFVAVLVFGASRVPALGDALGRAVSGFRRASRDVPSPPASPRMGPDENAASRR